MIIVNGSCVFRNSKRTYQASNLYDGLENERPCAEPGKEESTRSPSLPLAAPRPSAPASVSTLPRGSVTRTHAHAHAHAHTRTHAGMAVRWWEAIGRTDGRGGSDGVPPWRQLSLGASNVAFLLRLSLTG